MGITEFVGVNHPEYATDGDVIMVLNDSANNKNWDQFFKVTNLKENEFFKSA